MIVILQSGYLILSDRYLLYNCCQLLFIDILGDGLLMEKGIDHTGTAMAEVG